MACTDSHGMTSSDLSFNPCSDGSCSGSIHQKCGNTQSNFSHGMTVSHAMTSSDLSFNPYSIGMARKITVQMVLLLQCSCFRRYCTFYILPIWLMRQCNDRGICFGIFKKSQALYNKKGRIVFEFFLMITQQFLQGVFL